MTNRSASLHMETYNAEISSSQRCVKISLPQMLKPTLQLRRVSHRQDHVGLLFVVPSDVKLYCIGIPQTQRDEAYKTPI